MPAPTPFDLLLDLAFHPRLNWLSSRKKSTGRRQSMNSKAKDSGSIPLVLAGGILLITLTGLFVAYVAPNLSLPGRAT